MFYALSGGERHVQITRYEERQKETAPENSQGKEAGKARKEEQIIYRRIRKYAASSFSEEDFLSG
jgi:hypothetical protein